LLAQPNPGRKAVGAGPTALAVIAAAAALMLASSWQDVLTVDEVTHLSAGYSYLARRDMRMNPEHPPLAKLVAALPLLAMDLNEAAFGSQRWREGYFGQYEFGRRLIYRTGNDATALTRWAHAAVIPFFALAAFQLFRWASRLYGERGGLLALVLFCLSPTVLAHGRLVTTDVPATMGVLLSLSAFMAYLRHPSLGRLLLAGLALGVAQLVKYSLLLLLPFLPLVALLWAIAHEPAARGLGRACLRSVAQSGAVSLIGLVGVVWPVYGFFIQNYPPEQQLADLRQHFDTIRLLHHLSQTPAGDALSVLSINPFFRGAALYLLGVLLVVDNVGKGHPVYWLGAVVGQGDPSYFPIVYLLKEPLGWWGLVGLAVATAIRHAARLGTWAPRLSSARTWLAAHFVEAVAGAWVALYWAASLRGKLTIGVRHLLPVYPFTILLVVGLLLSLHAAARRRGRRPALAVAGATLLLVAGSVAESLSAFPHYLAFFNVAAGGPAGGARVVADSNLDWGQDLWRFCRWAERSGIPRIELDYFGWADVPYYCGDRALVLDGPRYPSPEAFLARNSSGGWLAVSATHMHYRYMGKAGPASLGWLQRYHPVAAIGHSIFVYRITAGNDGH
jgi:hypothetical protein